MDAPFYINQEVVALLQLENAGVVYIKKGNDYTIQDLHQCKCGLWLVKVGVDLSSLCDAIKCLNCGSMYLDLKNSWISYRAFAPKQFIKSTMIFEEAIKLVTPKKLEKVSK